MTAPTLDQLGQAVRDTLVNAAGVVTAEHALTMTEAVPDVPLLQIYWTLSAPDETPTERRTFGGTLNQSLREVKHTWHVDCYIHERGEIGENISANYALSSAVMDVLNQQNDQLFGINGIEHYHWQAERVQIENGNVTYEASRFTLELWTY